MTKKLSCKLAFPLIAVLSLGACAVVEDLGSSMSQVFETEDEYARVPDTPGDVTKEFAAPEAPMDYALYEQYMDLAEARYFAGSETDFEYFADRAIAVANGEDISPAIIDPNLMSSAQAEDMKRARERLVEAQTAALTRAYNPNRASLLTESARAQVLFDCRVRELHRGTSDTTASSCGQRFTTSIAALETALDSGPGATKGPSTFVLYFDKDSTEIDIRGRAIIAEAQATARKIDGSRLIVVGGSRKGGQNNVLSALRAEAVARELEAGGLPVKLDWPGGSKARLVAASGKDPESNRRVEIKIER